MSQEKKLPISEGMRNFLDRQARQSEIKAMIDAGREANVRDEDLILEDNLEMEVLDLIEAAKGVGILNYAREDAIKALIQADEHKKYS